MNKKLIKKVLMVVLLFTGLLLTVKFVIQPFFLEKTNLINKIDLLQKDIENRDKIVKQLEQDIKNKKTEIIEKEKIIYKDGKLIIPEDYNELKNNYIVLSEINNDQKMIISKLEEKSNLDDKIIVNLSKALDESKITIQQLSKKELFSHSVIASSDFKSFDLSYLLLINEKLYIGIGGTSNMSVKLYIGIKL